MYNVNSRKDNHLSKPKKPKAVKHEPTLDLGTERMVTPPAGQPKDKKARAARVYRINPKLATKGAELTAPQTSAIFQTLADNPLGLTAEQIEQKVAKLGFKSKNPKSVIGACLYDLRKGVASCKIANLVEIVKPEAAPTEKKPKSAKPKAEPAPAQTPAA
jgi:hypothetical protein